jgi:hypothetical protein
METNASSKMNQEYYIPDVSPVQTWDARSDIVNKLSVKDIDTIVKYWLDNDDGFHYVTQKERPDLPKHPTRKESTIYFQDGLKPTKKDGHPQATISTQLKNKLSFNPWELTGKSQVKLLRHLVVWRYMNKGALVPEELHISHADHDHTVLNLIAESKNLNESRKYCHMYQWACPHVYHKCT